MAMPAVSSTQTSLRPRHRRLQSVEKSTNAEVRPQSAPPSSHSPISASASTSTFTSAYSHNATGNASPSETPRRSHEQGSNGSGSSHPYAWQPKAAPTQDPRVPRSLFSAQSWGASWSSIQHIATTLVGREDGSHAMDTPGRPRAQSARQARYGGPSAVAWGPPPGGLDRLASGSTEERRALVQAEQRQTLLNANGYVRPDSRGHYKRRQSSDSSKVDVAGPSLESSDQTGPEQRVYIHRVLPQDTMAGVAIRYGCPQASFRKINRLWPNDTIQIRQHVFLPVEACGVRGRKLSDSHSQPFDHKEEKLDFSSSAPQTDEDDLRTPTLHSPDWTVPEPTPRILPDSLSTASSSVPSPPSVDSHASSSHATLKEWIHDAWVRIDGFSDPVEIGRLQPRSMGFFPRARRKSSAHSQPPDSLTSPPASSPHPSNSQASRSSSTGGTNLDLSTRFVGTGGVGTLGPEAKTPGAPPDSLNHFFAQHLPAMTLSANNTAVSPSLLPVPGPGGMSASPSRPSLDSVGSWSSTGTGAGRSIEALGGRVERWARKMATRTTSAGNVGSSGNILVSGPSSAGLSSRRTPNALDDGDLIELVEGWDAATQRQRQHSDPRSRSVASSKADGDDITIRLSAPTKSVSDSHAPADSGGNEAVSTAASTIPNDPFGVPAGGRVFGQQGAGRK